MIRARNLQRLGGFWDVVEDLVVPFAVVRDAPAIYNWFSDAGKTIGQVLKFIAPIVALWPGVGTAISVALSAAAAYACGDKIDDAIIDTASAAIPGGVPRAIFQGAADISRDVIAGRPAGASVLGAARQVAGAAGGDRAQQAFDFGVHAAQGENIGDDTVAAARAQLGATSPEAEAAFDGGVAIARGGSAADAVQAAARDYIGAAGGPGALAAFDFGFAIARGKDLQDAGFDALRALAEGNDPAERAVHFAEAMTKAAEEGKSVKDVLVEELTSAWAKYGDAAKEQLGAIVKAWNPQWNDMGSADLASYLGVDELMARAAQSIMRDLTAPDTELLQKLTTTAVQNAVEKYGAAVVASTAVEGSFRQVVAQMHSDELMTALRISPAALSYGAVLAQQQAALPVAAPPVPPPPPEPPPAIVAAANPSRSTLSQDVLLGVTVAAALGALYWWATNGKAA